MDLAVNVTSYLMTQKLMKLFPKLVAEVSQDFANFTVTNDLAHYFHCTQKSVQQCLQDGNRFNEALSKVVTLTGTHNLLSNVSALPLNSIEPYYECIEEALDITNISPEIQTDAENNNDNNNNKELNKILEIELSASDCQSASESEIDTEMDTNQSKTHKRTFKKAHITKINTESDLPQRKKRKLSIDNETVEIVSKKRESRRKESKNSDTKTSKRRTRHSRKTVVSDSSSDNSSDISSSFVEPLIETKKVKPKRKSHAHKSETDKKKTKKKKKPKNVKTVKKGTTSKKVKKRKGPKNPIKVGQSHLCQKNKSNGLQFALFPDRDYEYREDASFHCQFYHLWPEQFPNCVKTFTIKNAATHYYKHTVLTHDVQMLEKELKQTNVGLLCALCKNIFTGERGLWRHLIGCNCKFMKAPRQLKFPSFVKEQSERPKYEEFLEKLKSKKLSPYQESNYLERCKYFNLVALGTIQ